MMKPKTNRKGDKHKVSKYDSCQTPPYALQPLKPYLRSNWVIWECASGGGMLAAALYVICHEVIPTDIVFGFDFFENDPLGWDCIVTNPPFSIKYDWLKRTYEFGKPFALLMPVEMLGAKTAQKMFDKYGIQVIFMDKRIDFKMPIQGWDGHGAQFPVAWYTWGLNLPKDILFTKIDKPPKHKLAELYG